MNKTDIWPAPGKLNLFLHITGRRDDGYHNLQTLFQFIDYCDELRFSVRDDGIVSRVGGIDRIPEQDDLTVRAAKLLQQATECKFGVDIRLDKRLPLGGGLGGGSSDAATTLVALNHLWGLGLPRETLLDLALTLGADVPIFVFGKSAWGEGIGEILTECDVPSPWYVVIHPGVHVSTAELFTAPELTRDVRPIKIRDYLDRGGENVFEPLVRQRYPAVNDALNWLSQQANLLHSARMTGTGSCVFAPFEQELQAREVMEKLVIDAPGQWQAWCVQACKESPLAQKMKRLLAEIPATI